MANTPIASFKYPVIEKRESFKEASSDLANIAEDGDNVQIFDCTICEKRPGGDVILASREGLLRLENQSFLEVGQYVRVKVIRGDPLKVELLEVLPTKDFLALDISNQSLNGAINYAANISSNFGQVKDTSFQLLMATITYLAPEHHVTLFPLLRQGSSVRVKVAANYFNNAYEGFIFDKNLETYAVKTDFGVLELVGQMKGEVGDNIFFEIMNIPSESELEILYSNLKGYIALLKEHRAIFAHNIAAIKNKQMQGTIADNLLQAHYDDSSLIDSLTNSRLLLADDVESWIEYDIMPSSARSKLLYILIQHLSSLQRQLVKLGLLNIPESIDFKLLIAGTEQYVKLNYEHNNKYLNIKVAITNMLLGPITIKAKIRYKLNKLSIKILQGMELDIASINPLPFDLQQTITNSFQVAMVNAGAIAKITFSKLLVTESAYA